MEQVTAARNNANAQQQSATEFASGGVTLVDELRKAIGERFGESDIAKEGATARTNFMAAAPKAREDVLGLIQGGSILSPTQQNAIIASKRASALAPVVGTNALQQMQFGTLEDLLNAGTNAWKAQATAQQGVADLASKNASDMLSELVTRANLAQQEQMNPLDILLKKAQIASAQRDASGGGSMDTIQYGDTVYKRDRYGNLTAIPGVNTVKTKFTESELAEYANGVAGGSMTISQVPQGARGQVDTLVNQIKSDKPFWQGGYEYNPFNFLLGR